MNACFERMQCAVTVSTRTVDSHLSLLVAPLLGAEETEVLAHELPQRDARLGRRRELNRYRIRRRSGNRDGANQQA
jgi:hypothetical protein